MEGKHCDQYFQKIISLMHFMQTDLLNIFCLSSDAERWLFEIRYENTCIRPLKPRWAMFGNHANCNVRLLMKQTSLFSGLCFISFVVVLSSKVSLHQRFMTRQNGRRESCSGVNWSVSARIKPDDSVACSLACQAAKGQSWNKSHITCFNSQWAHSDGTCC